MQKIMTPMKRLSNGLDILKFNIKPFFIEKTLNKTEPHYNRYGGKNGYGGTTKGVENDFITIFQAVRGGISFAISFTYINLPSEDQRVQVSIKPTENNDDIISSVLMTIDEFKLKLNEINKDMKEKKLTEVEILQKVSSIFLDKKFDLKGEIEEADKKIKSFIKTKSSELEISLLEKKAKDADKELNQNTKEIINDLVNSAEQKRIEQLQQELIALNQKQEQRKKQLEKEKNIPNLTKVAKSINDQLNTAKFTLNKEIEKELKKLPTSVAKRVKF